MTIHVPHNDKQLLGSGDSYIESVIFVLKLLSEQEKSSLTSSARRSTPDPSPCRFGETFGMTSRKIE